MPRGYQGHPESLQNNGTMELLAPNPWSPCALPGGSAGSRMQMLPLTGQHSDFSALSVLLGETQLQ